MYLDPLPALDQFATSQLLPPLARRLTGSTQSAL
jgi:hypothetical protein